MTDFQPFPKLARLNRDIVITEKIDGTNAAVVITEEGEVLAQSRTRFVTPEKDNFGFAAWVKRMETRLLELGPGVHFGEWWGAGIQRGYGQSAKAFSLFNVARWAEAYPSNDSGSLRTVPVLYEGPLAWPDGLRTPWVVVLEHLKTVGSVAAKGFMQPEGIVMYHTASRTMFKVTLENDGVPKSLVAA